MRTVVALLLVALASSQLLGGWQKRSFAENDLFIDSARVTAEKKFYEETGTNDSEIDITPLCIYSQLVNGFNYQIIFSARNMKTNELGLYQYVIYTGPFGQTSPQIQFIKKIPNMRQNNMPPQIMNNNVNFSILI